MGIIKTTVSAIFLMGAAQLAVANPSVEAVFQKHQQKNIEVVQKYAAANNKEVPEIVEYQYGMNIDVAKRIHMTPKIKSCGTFKRIMSYEDSQGKLHSVSYTRRGDCENGR